RPSEEKARERSVGLAEEDVLSARARQHGRELRAGDRGGHREETRHRPDGDEERRRAHQPRALGRDDENPGADHRTDDERRRGEPANAAAKKPLGQRGLRLPILTSAQRTPRSTTRASSVTPMAKTARLLAAAMPIAATRRSDAAVVRPSTRS